MRIGIYGGSFDPPHNGHASLAQNAKANLDMIWIVPTRGGDFKQSSPFAYRLLLCEALCQHLGNGFRVMQVDQGLTVDTITYLTTHYPEHQFTFILGEDVLADAPTWKGWDKVVQMVSLHTLQRTPESSTAIRKAMAEGDLETAQRMVPPSVWAVLNKA